MHSEMFTIKVGDHFTIGDGYISVANQATIQVLTQSNVVKPGVPA